MVFDNLSNNEKVYWLNYLTRMESLQTSLALQLNSVAPKIGMHPRRQALLKEANLFYKDFYTEIKEELLPLITKEAFTNVETLDFDYKGVGTFSFNYLIRDWGHRSENQQMRTIIDKIEETLSHFKWEEPKGTALFLGCGTGRYAVDLAPRYQQVEAFDASILMLWCLENLQKKETWDVLRKVERNCRKIEDTVQHVRLAMTAEELEILDSKVNFFLADAAEIPLADQSIDHIYSLYFTDVLPLHALYEDTIDRLLLEEGLFIHFGPLEYFFYSEKEMLTAEEVSLFFEQKEYHILVDEFVETKHLANPNSMRHRVYDNWFFIAQKPKRNTLEVLHLESILILNQAVEISRRAILEQGVCIEHAYTISLLDQSYELPAVVYDILLNCHGNKTIKQVFEEIGIEGISVEESNQLMTILQELLVAKMLLRNTSLVNSEPGNEKK